MNNANYSAYPLFNSEGKLNPDASGLTKREILAAMAMQGILSNPEKDFYPNDLAEEAVRHADALLLQLTHRE